MVDVSDVGRLAINALGSVPRVSADFVAVNVIRRFRSLALAKVFDGAQHVGLNGLDVFNSLAHDDRLRIALLESFRHYAVLGTVEEPLLPISKCVVRNVAELVLIPDVIASALLAWCPVAVRLLIHLLNLLSLLQTAAHWVDSIFSLVRYGLTLDSEGNIFRMLWPVIGTAVTLS